MALTAKFKIVVFYQNHLILNVSFQKITKRKLLKKIYTIPTATKSSSDQNYSVELQAVLTQSSEETRM